MSHAFDGNTCLSEHAELCRATEGEWFAAPLEPAVRSGEELLPDIARVFLDNLLRMKLLSPLGVRTFLGENPHRFPELADASKLGNALIQAKLLTQYQFDRILADTAYGLVLGNHKIIDRLGAGGMGVVFLAEHLYLNRREAIKVLPVEDECSPELLSRFYSEMQVLAELRHANIVGAYDAGQVESPGPGLPALLYLAMELVEGWDLERYVIDHGRVPVRQACDWIRQAALGLQEAHDRHIIHRDIKPSNLLLSKVGQVKLVDFGLVRQFSKRMTQRGKLLGTIDYMPPEQSFDASAVGTTADIYGLGASLFWLLTAEPPYPRAKQASLALKLLQESPPRALRSLRPDAPGELEALLQSLLNRDPTSRPSLPLTVGRALLPFIA